MGIAVANSRIEQRNAELRNEAFAPEPCGALLGLRDAVAARIDRGDLVLPMLPQIAGQVLAASADPNTDAAKLSTLIHRDPALAGQVLKIANSPAYQPRMPIVSLQQAVARLGSSVLTEISLAASLQSGVFKVPGFEKELAQLWAHAIASSAWAKEIARSRRFSVESAFLCGLMHSLGKPVVLQAAVDETRRAGAPVTPDLRLGLQHIVDELHVRAGLLLAARWDLPAAVRAAIEHYRAPEAAQGHFNDAACAGLAHALGAWLVEHDCAAAALPRSHAAFASLNFYQDEIDALAGKADLMKRMVSSLTAVA